MAVGVFSTVAPAGAEAGANNVVQVTNRVDGGLAATARAQVAYAPADTVGHENVATATSSCVGCRTVAVAVQVVIVESYPSEYVPHNAAAAVNMGCSSCETFAYARQIVVQPAVKVHLDPAAHQQIQGIQWDMNAVASSDLGLFDMKAELDVLADQLEGVVRANMERVGVGATFSSQGSVDIPVG